MHTSIWVTLALGWLLLRSLGCYSTCCFFCPLLKQDHGKVVGRGFFSSREMYLPGEWSRGSFQQVGSAWDAGAEQHLQETPPALEVDFVLGLFFFLEGPLELVNAALTEAGPCERARHAVISLPLLS